jgi:leader peptidase (prepilin peptidase)/N-methyltransferase
MIMSWHGAVTTLLLGGCVGSYATTAAIRAARMERSSSGRSHCDACGVTLGFSRTIPMLSYVMAGGRCADCGARINPMHIVGEISGGVIALLSLWAAPDLSAAALTWLGLGLLFAAGLCVRTGRAPLGLSLAAAGFGLGLISWSLAREAGHVHS